MLTKQNKVLLADSERMGRSESEMNSYMIESGISGLGGRVSAFDLSYKKEIHLSQVSSHLWLIRVGGY